MAEAADGRDGWSARRGGSTIDVTRGGQMMVPSAGAGRGAVDRDRAAFLACVGTGPVRLGLGGWFPSPAQPRVPPGLCVWEPLYV